MSEHNYDWNLILSLKELTIYLDTCDIMEIYLSCKYLNMKNKCDIFKKVNTNKIVEIVAIGPGNEESYDQKYQALDNKLNGIKKFVNHLEFDIQSNPFYIQVISEYFINLSYLVINECIIPFTVLENIFKSAQSLTYLSLVDNLTLFKKAANSVERLDLPKSIKFLELGDNAAVTTDYWEDPLLFFQTWSDNDSDTAQISLKLSSKLPNLTYLHLMNADEQIHNNLENFLISNTQLKHIKLYMDNLTPSILQNLTECKQLKSVEILPCIRGNFLSVTQNHHILPNVKKLTLDKVFHKGQEKLTYICSPFINITELTLTNIGKWPLSLYLIIQKFRKLEKLTIHNTEALLLMTEFFIASQTLKSLEFKVLENLDFRLNLLGNCPKITSVSIDTSKFTPNGLAELLKNLRKSPDWTLLKFSNSIKCYKK